MGFSNRKNVYLLYYVFVTQIFQRNITGMRKKITREMKKETKTKVDVPIKINYHNKHWHVFKWYTQFLFLRLRLLIIKCSLIYREFTIAWKITINKNRWKQRDKNKLKMKPSDDSITGLSINFIKCRK